jgi:hypothetical protein
MLDHDRFASPTPDVDSDALLGYLTSRQHLHPHAPVLQVLDQTIDVFGCCPNAVRRALPWLGIAPGTSIGRLRRSELVQLARAVHRFWTQAAAEPVAQ